MCKEHFFHKFALSFFLIFNTIFVSAFAERSVVRVGFFPYDGYHMMSDSGERTGYGYEYLQRMLVFANWHYEYVGYEDNKSWNDMIAMLADGRIDLLTSATKSSEREKIFAYSDLPIGTSATIVTVRAGDNRFSVTDFSNWNGMRVGLLRGNSRNESFARYAAKNGFSYNAFYYNSDDELSSELAKKILT